MTGACLGLVASQIGRPRLPPSLSLPLRNFLALPLASSAFVLMAADHMWPSVSEIPKSRAGFWDNLLVFLPWKERSEPSSLQL